MKYIKKGKEPSSLTRYRKKKDAYFDGYPEKDDLRKSLLQEQKYICCYCMSRIVRKEDVENADLGQEMKIEHYKPKNQFSELELTYKNLLGACKGQYDEQQFCDTHKSQFDESELLTIDPQNVYCEEKVKFYTNGEIYSEDDIIHNDLTSILNLNCEYLIKRRKNTFDEWQKKFIYQHPKGTWSKAIWQQELDKWENVGLEEYRPYCQVVIAYLKNKIKKAS